MDLIKILSIYKILAKTITIFKKLLRGTKEVKASHSEMMEFNLKTIIKYLWHIYY